MGCLKACPRALVDRKPRKKMSKFLLHILQEAYFIRFFSAEKKSVAKLIKPERSCSQKYKIAVLEGKKGCEFL